MDKKKFLIKTCIIIGVVLLLMFILLIINSKTSSCDEGDEYLNQTSQCVYKSSICKENEEKTLYSGDEACLYYPKGFINNSFFKNIMIFLCVLWVILLIVTVLIIMKKGSKLVDIDFGRENFVYPDRAIDLIALHLSIKNNMTRNGSEYKKNSFKFFNKTEPFQKGKEWFLQSQVQMKDGDNPGVYTFIVSLSRGEEWILGGMYNIMDCNYNEYKRKKGMPLSTSQDMNERLIELYTEKNPDKALEMQEKMIEEQVKSSINDTYTMDNDQQQKIINQYENEKFKRRNR